MKYQEWIIKNQAVKAFDPKQWQGFGPLSARVLHARGLENGAQAREFLWSCTDRLEDPMRLRDMDRAVARIRKALDAGERIAVYGDYDVDGITSVCVLYRQLRGMGGDVTWYIPDRIEEGYGIHRDALEQLRDQGVRLLVTVDTGITAVEEVAYAKELGIDTVITDHHECKKQLPDACAVVDPCRGDSEYSFRALAGVGVAFKLVCALEGPQKIQCMLKRYADLVALGTVADVMQLTGENRIMVRRGLQQMESPKNPGLAKLIIEAGAESRRMNTVVLGFVLAPRINAAGRMGQADKAVRLLLSDDEREAAGLAAELCALNRQRQEVESKIFADCCKRWDRRREEGTLPSVLVTDGENWHPGVIGIVASKLMERYGRPVMMISVMGDEGKGSARSVPGFNMFEALEVHKRFLLGYGGHEMAAGFSIAKEQIPMLRQHMEEYGLDFTEQCKKARTLEADCALRLEEITEESVRDLQGLEPYGTGNPQPVFLLEEVELGGITAIGGGKHIRMKLCDGRRALDAVCFGVGENFPFTQGQTVDVVGTVDLNCFRNTVSVQMIVTDLRESTTQRERDKREKRLYLKLIMQQTLSPEDAREILPERKHFVAMWRYLQRNGGSGGVVERPVCHIARTAMSELGEKPSYAKTMICLDVMAQFDLLEYQASGEDLLITLKNIDGKVDLNQGKLLQRLREMTDPGEKEAE